MNLGKHKKSGFTLVEIIVVILLITLIVAAGYYVFSVGLNYYYTTSEQVEAQENCRLITNHFEKELGNAQALMLLDYDPASPPEELDDGAILFFTKKNVNGNENALYAKTSAEETIIGYPVENLFVDFQKATDQNDEIVYVFFNAEGIDQFMASVKLYNTQALVIDPSAPNSRYDAVLFFSY